MTTCALLLLSILAFQKPADPFQPIRFLAGTWTATAAGSGDMGVYSFEFDLKDKVMVRRATANGEHNDILYIYPEGPKDALKAIYFDSEGHVIHYDVTTPTANKAVFEGGMYRLIYELKSDVMGGKFQVKPPGTADYTSYLEWTGRKK